MAKLLYNPYMSTIYSNNPTIDIPFPGDIFNSYLKKLNLNSENELDDVKTELIFAMAFKDFKIGKISLDNFSEISGCLFHKLKRGMMQSSHFGSVLLNASELNFYIRNFDSDTSIKNFTDFMTDVENYFKKDRPELLDKV